MTFDSRLRRAFEWHRSRGPLSTRSALEIAHDRGQFRLGSKRMHRALIVSSHYDPATGYSDREAWRVSNKRLGARLRQHGYAVEWLQPGAGLVKKLREALATEDPLSAVVLVFSGYVLLTESGDPAILLSDEQVIALRLEQLCTKASRTFGRVLLVLDGVRGSSTRVVQEANPTDADVSAENLLARMAVRTVRGDNVGMLVRIAPWGVAEDLPEVGLCEQLTEVLENLDDAQALSTVELELGLLNLQPGDGSTVLCRHSKPAFVFLPARRFASEPPKPPPQQGNAPSAERSSYVDDSVDPYTSRGPTDDREAWTPPPDPATLAAHREYSSRAPAPAEQSAYPTAAPSGASEAQGSAGDDGRDIDEAFDTLTSASSGQSASAVELAQQAIEAPEDSQPTAIHHPPSVPPPPPIPAPPPRVSAPPPPLPVWSAPPLPGPSIAQPAPAWNGSLPQFAAPNPPPTTIDSSAARRMPLGTPPPLPSERGSTSVGSDALEHPRGGTSEPPRTSRAPSALGTPPPLPFERAAAGPQFGGPPALPPLGESLPRVGLSASPEPEPAVGSGPTLSAATATASETPASIEPRSSEARPTASPARSSELGVPPPLPSERAAMQSNAELSPETAEAAAQQTPATSHASPTAATDDADVGATRASLPAPVSDPSPSASPPGPPPRKRRDSGVQSEGVSGGAPSLPPPVVSPESWRPSATVAPEARDEAALLQRAQAALAANDLVEALAHAQACLESFPESALALQIAAGALVSRGDFASLAGLYDDLIRRLSPAPEAAQLCAAASRLWLGQLRNPGHARELLERGLLLDPHNPSLQRELADLLDSSGDHAQALQHSLAALRANPVSPAAAQAAFQRLSKSEAKEQLFTVACLLSFLGHAGNREVDVLAAHRGATLPRPTRSLQEDDFRFGLDVAADDPELTRALAMLEPYVRQLELPKSKQQRQLLESLRAEDVERSTTMLARTFGWTCRLLTLGSPALYLADADSLPALLPVESTGFVVGKALGRGLSLAELAFLWGRALSWSRPQTRILYTLGSSMKLTILLRAACANAGLGEPAGADTKQLAKALKKDVPPATWTALGPTLAPLQADLDERVERWKHAADRIANRVGLLACGDPELAARTLDRFPTTDSGTRRQQLSELLGFALSDEYQELRRRLGLHLG